MINRIIFLSLKLLTEAIRLTDYHTGINNFLSDEGERAKFETQFSKGENGIYSPDRKIISDIGRDILLSSSADISKDRNGKSLDIERKYEIFNILKNNEVAERVINTLEKGGIDVSENPINGFSVESEFKVLGIKIKKLETKLEQLGFELKYEGLIWDIYNDFVSPEHRLDNIKAIHRNRYKVNQGKYDDPLLTLKRKNKEKESTLAGFDARICWEIEYVIKRFRECLYDFEKLGLQPFREKLKYRWAYILERDDGIIIKVDVDKYPQINHIAEFEISRSNGEKFGGVDDEKIIKETLKELGLKNNKKVGWGSRKLHEKMGVDYLNILN